MGISLYIPLNYIFLDPIFQPHDGRAISSKITNYKIQITNKSQITMSKITNKKLIKSFCGGPDVSRGQFFQKAPPLAAGGKNN
jgi:hypothetical protein